MIVEAIRMYELSKIVKRKISIIGQRLRLREKEISNEKMESTGSWKTRKREFKVRKLKNKHLKLHLDLPSTF